MGDYWDIPVILRFVFIFVFAVASYYIIEQPFRKYKKSVLGYTLAVFSYVSILSLLWVQYTHPSPFIKVNQLLNTSYFTTHSYTLPCFFEYNQPFNVKRAFKCLEVRKNANPKTKRVLLFGDSHARQWYENLRIYAHKNYNIDVYVLTVSSCFIFGQYYTKQRQFCKDLNPFLLKQLKTKAVYFDGIIFAELKLQSKLNNPNYFKKAVEMINTVTNYIPLSLIVADEPYYNYDIPHLVNKLHTQRKEYRFMPITTDIQKQINDVVYVKKLKNKVNKPNQVMTTSVINAMCTHKFCRVATRKSILYWDNSHLSDQGTAYYVYLFDPFLNRISRLKRTTPSK